MFPKYIGTHVRPSGKVYRVRTYMMSGNLCLLWFSGFLSLTALRSAASVRRKMDKDTYKNGAVVETGDPFITCYSVPRLLTLNIHSFRRLQVFSRSFAEPIVFVCVRTLYKDITTFCPNHRIY